jgi:hypothetical protein
MAVAKDAVSRIGTGIGQVAGDGSWTHTPSGTPRAVLVFVNVGTHTAGGVTGVTYGGTTMTQVSGSPVHHAVAEVLRSTAWVLLSSVPTGAQSVAVDNNLDDDWSGFCVTVTSGGNDCGVVDSDGTINSGSVADPSITLALTGETCFCAIAPASGQNAVTGIAPLSGWTADFEDDLGGQVTALYTYDTISTADVTAGWTQTAEDAVAMAVAIAEVSGAATPWAPGPSMSLMGVGR